jgi:hypothetical protein
MEFDASLADLIVYHEQFIGTDNQQLRLLSARELNTNNKIKEQNHQFIMELKIKLMFILQNLL